MRTTEHGLKITLCGTERRPVRGKGMRQRENAMGRDADAHHAQGPRDLPAAAYITGGWQI